MRWRHASREAARVTDAWMGRRSVARRAGATVMVLAGLLSATAMACQPEAPPPPAAPDAPPPEPEWLVELRSRPVVIPPLLSDGGCPVSEAAQPTPPPPSEGTVASEGVALYGSAPVAPMAFHSSDGVLPIYPREDGLFFGPARWTSRTGYRGPVLIRAFRIDGPGRAEVLLRSPMGELDEVIEVIEDWQFWAGETSVTGPGCYLLQIAGDDFTEHIVFRAEQW